MFSEWLYLGFTAALFIILIGIFLHYYNPKKKDTVEKPKYRIFDDEEGK